MTETFPSFNLFEILIALCVVYVCTSIFILLMKLAKTFLLNPFALLLSVFVFCISGCEGGDDGPADIGDNDPELIACVGDSITKGYACDGSPYPAYLASMTGKRTINYGVGGQTASYGAAIIGSVLANKPGYVCILFGANDTIGNDEAQFKEALRAIVVACKNNQSIAIIGTCTPMYGEHSIFNNGSERMAKLAREVAKEEGVKLADTRKAFGNDESLINSDGLHMTAAGSELIAKTFAQKIH